MSRRIFEDIRAIQLIGATARTTAFTSVSIAVEQFEDDAMVIVNVGGSGVGPSAPVTIVGALEATPTVFNRVLATFATVNALGTAESAINLNGIVNIQANLNVLGSTSVTVAVIALVRPQVKSATNNSSTLN